MKFKERRGRVWDKDKCFGKGESSRHGLFHFDRRNKPITRYS